MSYDRPAGTSGGNTGNPPSLQDIGAKIAGNQGGYQYESRPGGSVSGGAIPERNTYSGISGSQEPGYEHVSAPSLGGGQRGGAGVIESSGGPTYNPSSLGQQGGGSGPNYGQKYGAGEPNLGGGSGTTGSATIGGAGINKETVGTGSGFGVGTGTGSSPGTGYGGGSGSATNTGAGGGFGVGSGTGSSGTGVAGTGSGSAAGTGTGSGINTGSASGATGGSGYQGALGNAQRTVEPYVAQAREAAAPYVEKAQEVGSAALESARPLINQAAGAATQAYNAAATELDARGINKDSTQQKLAEVGQIAKDYGAVGQQRAGEYLQQAVDQAKTIGQDRENKSIVATIFGTVFLVWLAFGFSIGAVFALGVAGSIAAVLSRYSRSSVSHTSQGIGQGAGRSSNYPTGQQTSGTNYSTGQQPSGTNYPTGQQTSGSNYSTGQQPSGRIPGTTSNLATPGVETHFPQPSHPDNSLHTNIGK